MASRTGGIPASAGESSERLRADALEADAVMTYQRRRALASLVFDAVRRADAAARLDAALRYARQA